MQVLFKAILLAFLSGIALAKDCSNDGECVIYWASDDCQGDDVGEYVPTCQGNCFVFPFNSIAAYGNGFDGTACQMYSDNNCQNEVDWIDNTVTPFGSACHTYNTFNSMKCWFDC
jgi:hypothetical protein